eukprot:GHVU01173724.1.p2 GENE.GHVU01173724.1~~GHVU01173724.1.p2  ORF type:complete len:100 (-),score=10.61 GHVU01173724.1:124-423(-)
MVQALAAIQMLGDRRLCYYICIIVNHFINLLLPLLLLVSVVSASPSPPLAAAAAHTSGRGHDLPPPFQLPVSEYLEAALCHLITSAFNRRVVVFFWVRH